VSLVGKPGYKETAVGWIPVEWSASKLDQLVEKVGSGVTPKGGSDSYLSSGIPLIRSQNIHWGRLSLRDVAFISEAQHERMSNSALKPSDVLLNITGASIGRCAVLPSDFKEGNVNQHVCIIRPTESLRPHYLSQYLLSEFGQEQIDKLQAGGNREGLNYQQIRGFLIALPPLPEQQKIAAILTAVDDKLGVIARQISAIQTLKQGLMQTLFTRGVGTSDIQGRWHPHTDFQDTELGRIPVGWSIAHIQELGDVIRGASPRPQGDPRYYGGNVPRLMGADVTRDGKWVMPKIDFLTEAGAKLSRPCPKGTLTVVCSGDVGIPAFLAVDACIHDGFLALINMDAEKVSKDYLYHVIFSLKQRLDSSATHGGVFTNLTTSIFKEFLIPLPSFAEQQHIAAALEAMDEKLAASKRKQTHYQSLKRGLMQKLLTGAWRVRLAEPTT